MTNVCGKETFRTSLAQYYAKLLKVVLCSLQALLSIPSLQTQSRSQQWKWSVKVISLLFHHIASVSALDISLWSFNFLLLITMCLSASFCTSTDHCIFLKINNIYINKHRSYYRALWHPTAKLLTQLKWAIKPPPLSIIPARFSAVFWSIPAYFL